jgi:hypothetical protein
VPVNNTRRASDGGSNISLFNQLYYNKQNNHSYINSNGNNSDENSPKNSSNPDDDSYNIELDNLNIYSEEKNAANSNEDDENEVENENKLRAYRSSFKQRGSITSGIPVFSVTSTTGGTTSLNSKQLGSQSSDEEDSNIYSGGGINNSMKYQRRTSKSRHEPYLDNNVGCSLNTSASYGGTHIGKTSPPYRTRQREQSFSGTNNLERFNGNIHRGSEPNPFDLIAANMYVCFEILNKFFIKLLFYGNYVSFL